MAQCLHTTSQHTHYYQPSLQMLASLHLIGKKLTIVSNGFYPFSDGIRYQPFVDNVGLKKAVGKDV